MNVARHNLVLALLGFFAFASSACGDPRAQRDEPPPRAEILLFVGNGTSPGDVAAVERILRGRRYSYSTANSPQLNSMNGSQLRAYRLLIVPGGNFEQIGTNLTPTATANIRNLLLGAGLRRQCLTRQCQRRDCQLNARHHQYKR